MRPLRASQSRRWAGSSPLGGHLYWYRSPVFAYLERTTHLAKPIRPDTLEAGGLGVAAVCRNVCLGPRALPLACPPALLFAPTFF